MGCRHYSVAERLEDLVDEDRMWQSEYSEIDGNLV